MESIWASYRCMCGFVLGRVPKDVLEDLPRCLGCGRTLRGPQHVRAHRLASVRELR
jgi:hypothetical protein